MYRFYILLISGLALSCGSPLSTDSTACPAGCPRILDPVCASDGASGYQYFHNECLMRNEMCRTGVAWSLTTMSLCVDQLDPIISKECVRPCHFIYDPICATNGKGNQIFGNDCIFAMENCLSNGLWIETHESECGL